MGIHRIGLSLAGLLLVGAASASAQTPGMVCGTVTNAAGKALEGVTVSLSVRDDVTPPSTIATDDKGHYIFSNLAGTYSLSFTLAGFKKYVRPNIQMGQGTERLADLRMEAGSYPEVSAVAEIPVGMTPVFVTTKKVNTSSTGPQTVPPSVASPHPCSGSSR